MRLLDHIAQCTEPFLVRQDRGDVWQLAGAADFARPLAQCPLRYVLDDELLRTCIALAYSEGDELSGCIDLLRIPAEQMWVEWNETVRRDELARIRAGGPGAGTAADALRAGTLISARPHGRAGSLRSFWLSGGESPEPLLAPVETVIALDGGLAWAPPDALLVGQMVAVCDSQNVQVDELLQYVGFRLEPSWQRYYQRALLTSETRTQSISSSLATVAFDAPMLLALFLLMAVRADLVPRHVHPVRLNAKRARLGKPPLLEHIEVSAPVFASVGGSRGDVARGTRRGPRFHHVRGHLVRRRDTIYWRGPHWRGHVRLGRVRSRTVELRLPG